MKRSISGRKTSFLSKMSKIIKNLQKSSKMNSTIFFRSFTICPPTPIVPLPCRVNQEAANKIHSVAQDLKIDSALGGTMGADDFYLGQGRLDGAFCDYSAFANFGPTA